MVLENVSDPTAEVGWLPPEPSMQVRWRAKGRFAVLKTLHHTSTFVVTASDVGRGLMASTLD